MSCSPRFFFSSGFCCRLRSRDILSRTLGLLVIGVLMVNTESMAADGPISGNLWKVLMYLGAILAWLAPLPGENGPHRTRRLRLLGAGILIALAFLYRSREPTD